VDESLSLVVSVTWPVTIGRLASTQREFRFSLSLSLSGRGIAFSYSKPPPPPASGSHGAAGDRSFLRVRAIPGDGTVPVRAAAGRQAAHRRAVPRALLPPQPTRRRPTPRPPPRSSLASPLLLSARIMLLLQSLMIYMAEQWRPKLP
jgi:hypothetical protein